MSTPDDIEGFFRHAIGLDASSIRVFADIDDSHLLLLPDRMTAKRVLISKERMIGTVITNAHKDFEQGRLNTDPRLWKSEDAKEMQKYLEEKNMLRQLVPELNALSQMK